MFKLALTTKPFPKQKKKNKNGLMVSSVPAE
jgi:hypothetical protein